MFGGQLWLQDGGSLRWRGVLASTLWYGWQWHLNTLPFRVMVLRVITWSVAAGFVGKIVGISFSECARDESASNYPRVTVTSERFEGCRWPPQKLRIPLARRLLGSRHW